MSSTTEHPPSHDPAHLDAGGHAHPGPGTYALIGVVLAVITAVEVYVYNVEALRAALVPVLLTLSAIKFALVVGFYMHLRFDNRLFTGVFGFGLLVAASVVTALLFLFHQYPLPVHHD